MSNKRFYIIATIVLAAVLGGTYVLIGGTEAEQETPQQAAPSDNGLRLN